MTKDSRIYIAGHRGLVGSAIHRELTRLGYSNILTRTRDELDLIDIAAVDAFFAKEEPEYVFLAAAKVGGILANNTYPAEFIHDNLVLQTNIIDASYRNNVERLLFLGSSCIYPKLAPQPMPESSLLTGPLEPTNRPYALAKIAGIASMARSISPPCPPISMALVTITTSRTRTFFPHSFARPLKPFVPTPLQSPFGEPERRDENCSTQTTSPRRASFF
jgi:hypothetical protein